jgi:hypothetical protein
MKTIAVNGCVPEECGGGFVSGRKKKKRRRREEERREKEKKREQVGVFLAAWRANPIPKRPNPRYRAPNLAQPKARSRALGASFRARLS